MAKFKFKHAVMSAGKSQELARVNFNYKIKNQPVLILTPTTDNRSGQGVVAARSGERILSTALEPGEVRDWFEKNLESLAFKPVCILIDESQFFTKDDIFAIKEIAVIKNGIPVFAYGLKSDFKGDLFPGSAACLAVAEEIIEIETVCAFCNKKAILNLRFNNGKPIRTGEQVMIGDNEYKQVCHAHYMRDDLTLE